MARSTGRSARIVGGDGLCNAERIAHRVRAHEEGAWPQAIPRSPSDLCIFTLRLADDALILGQRLSEWGSNAPFLEEELALASTALAGIAAKALKEADYHLLRSHTWMLRLGQGTQESHRRAQLAITALAPYSGEMFEMDAQEAPLLNRRIDNRLGAARTVSGHRHLRRVLSLRPGSHDLRGHAWPARAGHWRGADPFRAVFCLCG